MKNFVVISKFTARLYLVKSKSLSKLSRDLKEVKRLQIFELLGEL